MVKVCICQICTCGGRHKCPHHPAGVINRSDQPCTLTEYATRYHKHPMEMVKSYKPDPKPIDHNQPMAGDTTQRVDYIKHPYSKPAPHMPDPYQAPKGDMEGMTSYNKEFTEKPIKVPKAFNNKNPARDPGKFEGDPTYRHDYRKWSVTPRKMVVRDGGYRPSSAPFEGTSNYKVSYVGPHAPVRKSMRPIPRPMQNDQPFDDKTGYRTEFVKHPIPPKEVRPKPDWAPNTVPIDDLSNYRKDYTAKSGGRMPSFKPDGTALQSDQPLADETTQRNDYRKWPAERPYQHQQNKYVKPEGDMCMDTTHHRDFTPKAIDIPKAYRPEGRNRSPGTFDGNTNYKNDFRRWSMDGRPKAKVPPGYAPPDAPFEGFSNYHDEFIKKPSAMRASMRPLATNRQSDVPFDDRTGYRDEFIKHPIPPKVVREQNKWVPSKMPIDDLSNYRKDYVAKSGGRMPSFKPDGTALQSDQPLADETTQRNDYRKWPAEQPYHHQRDPYVQPQGEMEKDTTTHRDYDKKPLKKTMAYKPPARQTEAGTFDGTTNYNQDFRKWTGHKRDLAKKPDGYIPPEAPFDGKSSYTDEYIKRNGQPRASMRPINRPMNSDTPFDGTTAYRTEYIKKEVPICPAVTIDTGRTNYVFQEQDMSGHKWYEPANTMPVREVTVA